MKFVDTHTHIYLDTYNDDREVVVTSAIDAGVDLMLLPNIDVASVAPMKSLHDTKPDHFSMMMGLHPTEVRDDYKKALTIIENELSRGEYVAIGEVGLDFYWDTTFAKQQKEALEIQLDWARQLNLPVSLHTRDAYDEMFRILEKKQDGGLRGVLHCFNEDEEKAKIALALGMNLGLGGVLTYKKCVTANIVDRIPLERILLETDAPFLAPVPHRGKRNEPAFVVEVAKKIAELKGLTLEYVASQTTENAKNLFKL